MDRREVKSFNRVFSIEPLTTYRGNPLFNVNYLAVAFLYDFPDVAGNPEELYRILNRWKSNKATNRDRVIVEVLKRRLSSFYEGKKIAIMI
jgi:hypothetical protein